jgi:hypothetical protein
VPQSRREKTGGDWRGASPPGLRADTPAPIEIPVVLSLTGNGALVGRPEPRSQSGGRRLDLVVERQPARLCGRHQHPAGLFAGINGIHDFRDGLQQGVGANAIVMVRYDAAGDDFVPISKRGGSPK